MGRRRRGALWGLVPPSYCAYPATLTVEPGAGWSPHRRRGQLPAASVAQWVWQDPLLYRTALDCAGCLMGCHLLRGWRCVSVVTTGRVCGAGGQGREVGGPDTPDPKQIPAGLAGARAFLHVSCPFCCLLSCPTEEEWMGGIRLQKVVGPCIPSAQNAGLAKKSATFYHTMALVLSRRELH